MWTPSQDRLQRQFKNFFQMTMFFLASEVTFLGEVHFMRNFFFTGNTSAEQLLLLVRRNIYFFGAATFFGVATFSEHLLLLSSYSFRTVTYSVQNFYGPATS